MGKEGNGRNYFFRFRNFMGIPGGRSGKIAGRGGLLFEEEENTMRRALLRLLWLEFRAPTRSVFFPGKTLVVACCSGNSLHNISGVSCFGAPLNHATQGEVGCSRIYAPFGEKRKEICGRNLAKKGCTEKPDTVRYADTVRYRTDSRGRLTELARAVFYILLHTKRGGNRAS